MGEPDEEDPRPARHLNTKGKEPQMNQSNTRWLITDVLPFECAIRRWVHRADAVWTSALRTPCAPVFFSLRSPALFNPTRLRFYMTCSKSPSMTSSPSLSSLIATVRASSSSSFFTRRRCRPRPRLRGRCCCSSSLITTVRSSSSSFFTTTPRPRRRLPPLLALSSTSFSIAIVRSSCSAVVVEAARRRPADMRLRLLRR